MADGDLRDQIARLEADIEELADGLDRCRKAMLLSKMAIAAGAILLLAYSLGPVGFDPTILIGAAMKDAKTHRANLIDAINPRAVDVRPGGLSR